MNIRITSIKLGTLMKLSKEMSIYLKCDLVEVKNKLSNLPCDFSVDTEKGNMLELLTALEVEFISEEVGSDIDIEEALDSLSIDDLEVRDVGGRLLVFQKSTDMAVIIEQDAVYEEIIRVLRHSSSTTDE